MSDAALPAESIRRIAERLSRAESALFITGAGISADSGLPTYRGIGGLYSSGETEEGLPIEVLLSGEMMRRDPACCWKYIRQIEAACRGAKPNAAHAFIAELERRLPRVVVLTQNVDGLHREAGSSQVIDIHGDLHRLRCTRCSWQDRVADYEGLASPPRCPACQGLIRPEVVLFGEMLPADAVRELEAQLHQGFDVVFSVGTTSVFPYIAYPVMDARRRGVMTVEVNPGDSEVSHLVDLRLKAGSVSAFGALRAAL